MYRYIINQSVKVEGSPRVLRITIQIKKCKEDESNTVFGSLVTCVRKEVFAPNWFERTILRLSLTDKFNSAMRKLLAQIEKIIEEDKESDRLSQEYSSLIAGFNKGEAK